MGLTSNDAASASVVVGSRRSAKFKNAWIVADNRSFGRVAQAWFDIPIHARDCVSRSRGGQAGGATGDERYGYGTVT